MTSSPCSTVYQTRQLPTRMRRISSVVLSFLAPAGQASRANPAIAPDNCRSVRRSRMRRRSFLAAVENTIRQVKARARALPFLITLESKWHLV